MAEDRARLISGVSERLVDVIVVEDDPRQLAFLAETLTASQCLVRSAASAALGLTMVMDRAPDVIVIELDLDEGLTGWVLAERLAEEPSTRHVARVAVTDRVEPRLDIVRSFDAYLRKPVDPRLLSTLVDQLADMARRDRRAEIDRRRAVNRAG